MKVKPPKRQERKQKCEAQNAGIFFVLGLRKGKKGIHYKKRKERKSKSVLGKRKGFLQEN